MDDNRTSLRRVAECNVCGGWTLAGVSQRPDPSFGPSHPQVAGEIASLTGLRGGAALLVAVNHIAQWASINNPPDPLWGLITNTAGMGMAIFFTLSGYVIALSYSERDWRTRPVFNFSRLLLHRVARLYPAFLVFALLIVLRTPSLRDLGDPEVQRYMLSRLLLAHTWLPIKHDGMLPYDDYFHVAWSLSVEAGLYVLFGAGAIVAALLPRWRAKPLVLAAICVLVLALLLQAVSFTRERLAPDWNDWTWAYWLYLHSPWGVALQFGLGVTAYRVGRHLSPSLAALASMAGGLGLVGIYGMIVCGAGMVQTPLDQALLVALATAVAMAGCRADTTVNAALSHRGIVFLGTVSYSFYLFHFLTPHLGFKGTPEPFDGNVVLYNGLNFAFALGMAIVLAAGMYALVERPGRRAIRSLADRLLGMERPPLLSPRPAE
jgi:peptidoglycan/LPS O-acetylase OafA/YrhL